MDRGATREEILDGFLKSQEFNNLCDKFGIKAFGGDGSEEKIKAVVKDVSFISNLGYECDGSLNYTNKSGEINCESFPIEFKIGNLKIGEVNNLTSDKIFYPQDILNLSRDNFTNYHLVLLSRLFQSLDKDKNIVNGIDIISSEDIFSKKQNLKDLNVTQVEETLKGKNIILVSAIDALSSLRKAMRKETSYVDEVKQHIKLKTYIKSIYIGEVEKINNNLITDIENRNRILLPSDKLKLTSYISKNDKIDKDDTLLGENFPPCTKCKEKFATFLHLDKYIEQIEKEKKYYIYTCLEEIIHEDKIYKTKLCSTPIYLKETLEFLNYKPIVKSDINTTTQDKVIIEIEGIPGTEVYINGKPTGIIIDEKGKAEVILDTSGKEGEKKFIIILGKNQIQTDKTIFTLTKIKDNMEDELFNFRDISVDKTTLKFNEEIYFNYTIEKNISDFKAIGIYTYVSLDNEIYENDLNTHSLYEINKREFKGNRVTNNNYIKIVSPTKEGNYYIGMCITYVFYLKNSKKVNICSKPIKIKVINTTTQDTIAPIITLKGDKKIVLYKGEKYKELGATAIDNIDGNITDKIVMEGKVDTSKVGIYTINYIVKDKAGNKAIARRTVEVKEQFVSNKLDI